MTAVAHERPGRYVAPPPYPSSLYDRPRLMTDPRLQQSYLVQPSVHDALYEAAQTLGIPTCPDFVTQEMDAIGFLGLLLQCGGTWKLVDGIREWDIEEIHRRTWVMDGIRLVSPAFMLPTAGAAWHSRKRWRALWRKSRGSIKSSLATRRAL